MTLNDIAVIVRDNIGLGSIVIAILMSIVQVSKIPVNPWSFIGNVLNKDLLLEVREQKKNLESLSSKMGGIEDRISETDAKAARYRIIRFDDEVRHQVLHTKEHYDQIIIDIDTYESFCKDNEWFVNNQAHWAIANIRKRYEEHNVDNSFL